MASQSDRAVLALDVGTSSCRASLYDLGAQPVGGHEAQIKYTARLSPDGGAELDADHLLEQVTRAIDGVLDRPAPPILGVGASTFWHSLLGLDADRKAVTPVYLWLDSRARAEVAPLRRRLDERAIHARTGCVLHWTYWPAKLLWLRRTNPDAFARVKYWVSFGEYLLSSLIGRSVASVSMASGTGLLNVHTLEWDAELLEVVGIDPASLGPVAPLKPVGTASKWAQLRDAPWVPAVGDGACSNLGAGCATPDHFALMVGTSGAERAVFRPKDDFAIPWGAWAYRVDERRVAMGGALNDGGSLVDWLHASLQLPDLQTSEKEIGELEPDGHGLTVLPYWGGERNPNWADDARGAILGMRLATRPLDILRACLESVALRFAEMDRILTQALPNSGEIIATGGGLLHSPAWMQIIADALGRSVQASVEAEASSRGATLLTLEALGLLETPLEAMTPEVSRRFDPVAGNTERYRAAVQRQRHLYDALLR